MRSNGLQASIKAQFGSDMDVLPYILYSDEEKIRLQGNASFHPLVLFLASPLYLLRAQGNLVIIAYLPVIGTESGLSGAR